MLHFVIAVSNVRDTSSVLVAVPGTGAAIRPFNARSLALSVLLGTHPPELPARALVALAELFGIPGGTMRTALSRMVAAGEVAADDGRYRLAGRLLDRQRAQDTGRRSPGRSWDGTWHTVVVIAEQREVTERRRFRALMADHRMGELRPDTWMRPANLPLPPTEPTWVATTGELTGIGSTAMAARLWDLEGVTATAVELLGAIDAAETAADWTDERTIPPVFTTSAAIVRFLRAEPFLPGELTPAGWPVDELRARYDRLEASFQRLLRSLFAAI
jgi:phenylacetic acid degradation operon negative regulatory protein